MSNSFSFHGAVGRDAELKQLTGGQAVLSVTVACNTGFGDKQQVMWVRCSLWGKRGESLAQYLKKGQQVFVSGELSMREYQANDGTTKSNMELNAVIIDLLGKRPEGQQAAPQQRQAAPQQRQAAPQQQDNFDDDIPF